MNSNCATLFRLLLGINYLKLVEKVKISIGEVQLKVTKPVT
jgi:hypothetical protein